MPNPITNKEGEKIETSLISSEYNYDEKLGNFWLFRMRINELKKVVGIPISVIPENANPKEVFEALNNIVWAMETFYAKPKTK